MTKFKLQIATDDEQDRIQFTTLPDVHATKRAAMNAAEKAAGRGAHYTGDGLSVRYSGQNGTVYVVEV